MHKKKKGSKPILVGDFNLDFNMHEEDFVRALSVKYLKLRTNPKHYVTGGCITINDIFSNKIIKNRHIYMSTYCCCMPPNGKIPTSS